MNECPARGSCPTQSISLPFSRSKGKSNLIKLSQALTMCLVLCWTMDIDMEQAPPIALTAQSWGQMVKRHRWNRMSDAERGVWWVGVGYLPLTIIPSTLKSSSFSECSQQPFLLPIVHMMPRAVSPTLQLSPFLLCQAVMCPP